MPWKKNNNNKKNACPSTCPALVKKRGNKLTCLTEQMLIRQEESAGARVKLVTAGESQHVSHQKIPTRALPGHTKTASYAAIPVIVTS